MRPGAESKLKRDWLTNCRLLCCAATLKTLPAAWPELCESLRLNCVIARESKCKNNLELCTRIHTHINAILVFWQIQVQLNVFCTYWTIIHNFKSHNNKNCSVYIVKLVWQTGGKKKSWFAFSACWTVMRACVCACACAQEKSGQEAEVTDKISPR